MNVSDVFRLVRDPYVAQFEMALRAQRCSEILVEPALRDRQGELVREGQLSLPCRVDVMLKTAQRVADLRLVTPTGVSFDLIELPEWGGMAVLIEPFEWFSCTLRVIHPDADPDWSPLRAWFDAAFGDDDHWVKPSAAKPTGRVHFLGDPIPRSSANEWQLGVDLGTAPVESLFDLVAALADVGVSDLWIGS